MLHQALRLPDLEGIYTFRALSCLYYPHFKPETASRYLRRTLHGDSFILQDLLRCGYQPNQRHITASQVACIVNHLGTPHEFISYTFDL